MSVKKIIIALIKVYQYLLSALLGNCCRFEPSCSHYTIDALRKFGCFRGSFLAMKRIACCHPWHPGGFNPVPDVIQSKNLEGKWFSL